MRVTITRQLDKSVLQYGNELFIVPMRSFSKHEADFARNNNIKRLYLPNLSAYETDEFFKEFDIFWEKVIKQFDTNHPFWRNVISSKMQEWEHSAPYLSLALFTITKKVRQDITFIFLCSSLEEENLIEAWGNLNGWTIYRKKMPKVIMIFKFFYQEITNAIWFLYRLFIIFKQKHSLRKVTYAKCCNHVSTVIASLFYNNSFQGSDYRDPFFDKFHQFLETRNHKCIYLCFPLEKVSQRTVNNIKEQNEVAVYIPYVVLNWFQILIVFLKLYFRRIHIRNATFMGCDFSELLRWNSRRNPYFFSNIVSELFFVSISKLNTMHSLERLLINFEGNCFERACIQAFKKSCAGKIIGYCQGVIYPLNLKLRMTSAEAKSRPEPDLFVCTGDYSKYLFMKIGKRDSSKIRSGCSLRYIPKILAQPFENKELKHVLFALDGANSSSALLDWIIEHAEKLKKFNPLIRTHPNVPFKRLLDQCINQCLTDIKHSEGNLSDDLSKSWCVVYRQTSIGMQALLNGIPSIHLSIDIPLSGDPLYDLSNRNWSASNIDELLNILENIDKSGLLINKLIENENKIVSEYFSVPSNMTMNDFL